MLRSACLVACLLVAAVIGCSGGVESARSASEVPAISSREATAGRADSTGESLQVAMFQGAEGELAATPDAAAERKIIYVADITLVVKDFATVEADIPELVKRFGGYLADTSVDRTQGAYRTGRWVARIPVERYDDFLAELEELGIPEHRTQTAQDVTEEYVDLEARIANKQKLEARILQLLEDRDGEIKDVIEVERELSRVREEIERMQGRLRYLANRTSLTTVTINVREEKDYVPPQAPSFTGRIGTAWSRSLESLTAFGQSSVIVLVAASPWLLVLLVPIFLVFWLVRRIWRRLQQALHKRRPAQI